MVLGVAASAAALDLAVKQLVENGLIRTVVDLQVVQLRLVHNSGVAFGVGDGLPAWIVVTVTVGIVVAMIGYAWKRIPYAGNLERVAGGAILGGAVANVADRARDGVVTDYLHTGWWPAFNLADAFLVVGILVFLISQHRFRPPSQKVETVGAKLPPTGSADGR